MYCQLIDICDFTLKLYFIFKKDGQKNVMKIRLLQFLANKSFFPEKS